MTNKHIFRVHEMTCLICGKTKEETDTEILKITKTHINNQIGGNHYKIFPIQPVEFIHKNNIGFMEGNAIKYLCRYKSKGGIEDLKKAKHYIEMLIEMELKHAT